MKTFSILLCAALLITGITQAHTYNEAATVQLVEFLSAPREDHRDNKEEALRAAREAMAQFITLIENGANPNIILPDGRELTLLSSIVLLDFYCIIIIAQTNRSYVEGEQLTGEEVQEFITAVHCIIKLLLDYGANPNTPDNCGLTTLFYACSSEITKMLIDYGADRSLQDDRGKTALQHHENERIRMLENIAQGKESGWPFCFSIETQRILVSHCDAVIEVLEAYKLD
jgi:ankyrin repeat protein